MDAQSLSDREKFLDFVSSLDGPTILTSILPDGTDEDVHRVAGPEAIDRANETSNIYWTVNRVRDDFPRGKAKPKKADIIAGRFAHIDVDDLSDGMLERIDALRPKPTLVIMSGGGYQAFWHIPAETTDLDRLEAVNKGLITRLKGDKGTHNFDRVMRVPGTVNLPHKKKRSRGRVPVAARLVTLEPRLRYTIDDLSVFITQEEPKGKPEEKSSKERRFPPKADALRRVGDPTAARASNVLFSVARDGVLAGFSDDEIADWLRREDTCAQIADTIADPAHGEKWLMDQIGRSRTKAKPETPLEPLEEVRARDLVADGAEPPPQEFLFGAELMPMAQVVALAGPTGVGKSLVALQAAFSVVTGRPWFGFPPNRTGNVVYYSAEDEIDELNRRLRSIQFGNSEALAKSEHDLIIIDRSGDEALLMIFDPKQQTMRPTTLFERVTTVCEKYNPVLTIVDTQNDAFSGNANEPGQARQFVTAWRRIAIRHNGVVLPPSPLPER